MENKSLWKKNIKYNKTPYLDKDINTDILIIGGGIAGLTTAYFLMNKKNKVVLIDSGLCANGASSYTTGKLTFLQDLIYHKIAKNNSEDVALKYLNASKEAIKIVRTIINKHNINCDLENTNCYVFTDNILKLVNFKKEEQFFLNHNIKFKTSNKIPIKYPCKYSIKVNTGSVFHPVKYLLGIKKVLLESDIEIYENTKAISIDKDNDCYIITTPYSKIRAKKVVVTTHYPFFITPGFIPFKTYIEKTYIVAGLSSNYKKIQAISNGLPVESIRFHQDKKDTYLIYAGESHKISETIDDSQSYKELIKKYKDNFNFKIKYYWLNHDISSFDSLPLIGSINNNNPYLLIGTAFNKWGMTNGTIAGKLLSDIILNKDNEYKDIFKPNRAMNIHKLKNMVTNNYNTSKSYVLSKLNKNHSFYKDNVLVVNKDGNNYGIYIDKQGKKHIVNNTCPHMKCSLIFNSVDKTWDCPCHGSRFDYEGNLLFGPAVFDIKVDKNVI